MVPSNSASPQSGSSVCPVAIHSLTESILQRFNARIESKNIRIETELESLTAPVFPKFIDSAVCKLIENAIDATPAGGELNVTLIDGPDCWELEVADSEFESVPPGTASTTDERSSMEVVRRAAIVHGGQVQTWDCPQGGTANVLVIPWRQVVNKAA